MTVRTLKRPRLCGAAQPGETQQHRCPGLPWSVLAAIGKVESDHGIFGGGRLQPDGSVRPRIIGIAPTAHRG